ncbi:hypothetical protein [Streptomyces specialis]|uniref:hypothetical protein n=1 Tax=Streptomyces specialis TaxID=498367 RepID=UPI00073E76D1|nr:hypothetical protein [Streptomyces specialis]
MSAAVAAAVAATVLPAGPARAAGLLPCGPLPAACVWSGPDATGVPGILVFPEAFLIPPVVSGENRSDQPWCLFEEPFFTGSGIDFGPGETIRALPFPARSAAPGECPG